MKLTHRQERASHRPSADGFSILELLIALGLLGTLLALAWSMLGSYRTAQQRGWDQSYRLRLAAAARDLLEQDALHFAPQIPVTNQPMADFRFASEVDSGDHTEQAQFQGSVSGFSITTIASIDPLPWLEEVLGTGKGEPEVGMADLYRSTDQQSSSALANSLQQFPTLLPQATRLRYAIQTSNLENDEFETSNLNPSSLNPSTAANNTILVRTVAPLLGSSQATNDTNAAAGFAASKAERVLGLNDLYRQTDPDADAIVSGVTTNSLRGMTNAAFRYSDGSQWRSSWDSLWDGGLPRAIEFSFDYATEGSSESSTSPSDIGFGNESSGEEIERDVRIVVLITAGQPTARRAPASSTFSGGVDQP